MVLHEADRYVSRKTGNQQNRKNDEPVKRLARDLPIYRGWNSHRLRNAVLAKMEQLRREKDHGEADSRHYGNRDAVDDCWAYNVVIQGGGPYRRTFVLSLLGCATPSGLFNSSSTYSG